MFNKKSLILFISLIIILSTVMVGAQEGKFAGQFTKEEMWVQESLDSYNEAPELKELVDAGKLPPVEERLPEVPRVVKSNIMANGIGEYGGVWRDTFAVPVASWNWGAQKTQGWFGINQMVQESLLISGPMWMLEQPDPLPNLVTDWEWSEDGKTLTMNLLEGVKWSDGEAFTADDVLFTYNDLILNDNIPTFGSKEAWVYGGQQTELEKINDYKIKWHFGVERPVHAFYNMDYLDFAVSPKHVYKHFHPDYNQDATYDDFVSATPPDDLPVVTLGPWIPTKYEAGQQLVMVRNPYYWQVDEEGNQLPYLSEVRFNEVESGDIRTMNLIGGSADRTNLENPETFSMVRQASLEEDAPFKIEFGPFGIGYHISMNLSRYLSVENDRDAELRELFREKAFREAVSHTISRDAVANVAFPGPLTQAWYGGYPSGSSYYDENSVVKYGYDPEAAKEKLASLGFVDTNGDGILNWPADSKIAGDELVIEMMINQDQQASINAAEAVQPMFREVGIDLKVRLVSANNVATKVGGGDFEMYFNRLDSAIPFIQMELFGPFRNNSPDWHYAASEGKRDLLGFEKEIQQIMQEARYVADAAERKEMFKEILNLYTENVYTVGVYEVRRGTGLHKRIRNWQPDIPPYMYNWTINSIPVQILYVNQEDQLETMFLDSIPTEEDYSNRSWHLPLD
ncbi:ABC transporter substrate-binding protein [Halanaerobium sp. ST460_2HS_T2]|uniref:ABC transporter substrate-binding protein n=1 Tax=Halanaerobium sp. ST460_2HS_T2 TaxID=2183914 RepID=UPI000DF442B7|nr:ABC transporter substrate-binding protein [Halanaerobium sp. ST460_2HS_T2]RCW62411.1 peptide/nickel transport system substrate-binding protein [Halanaerobium sp. ST460_2HS_T2]